MLFIGSTTLKVTSFTTNVGLPKRSTSSKPAIDPETLIVFPLTYSDKSVPIVTSPDPAKADAGYIKSTDIAIKICSFIL